ncbi:hypothetical protein [Pseudoruegeria sp. HB172150]|uniref:hypothetical protein n=1 Tax=Pseudoruegeria sp. HB172150 TaxID=2721164 RepID=UPI0015538E74|nr:hypothetical protein [Pseudoruegeria sp. HB172150]
MPLDQIYQPESGILSIAVWGYVSDVELDEARDASAQLFVKMLPTVVYFDLRLVIDYPEIYPRCVRFLNFANGAAEVAGRTLPILISAPFGSLGHSIGRVYLSQSVVSPFISVELVEDVVTACDRLRRLTGSGGCCPVHHVTGEGTAPAASCLCAVCPIAGGRVISRVRAEPGGRPSTGER